MSPTRPDRQPIACRVSITFAEAVGKQLNWTSARDCDAEGHVSCSSSSFPGEENFGPGTATVSRQATINGRRTFFASARGGGYAWACIPTGASPGDIAVAGLWENGFIAPQAAMALVAHATH